MSTTDTQSIKLDTDAEVAAAAKALGVTEKAILDLKAKHGKLVLITHPVLEWSGLFVRPNRITWKRFRMAMQSDSQDKQASATEDFALACAVLPDRKGFDVVLEEFPGLAESVTGELSILAGGAKPGMLVGKVL